MAAHVARYESGFIAFGVAQSEGLKVVEVLSGYPWMLLLKVVDKLGSIASQKEL